MDAGCQRFAQFIRLGAIHGVVAWSAYGVVEFVFSSVLYAVARRYSTFTPWHWELTAQLLLAYIVAGLLLGAAAGAAAYLLTRKLGIVRNPDCGSVLESAAMLTVVLAFAVNVLANPLTLTGKHVLFWAAVLFAVLLAARMRSAAWSARLGFLLNPWVVPGLLLGLGQEFAVMQIGESARTLGAHLWVWITMLAVLLAAAALGSIVLGRTVGRRLHRDRFTLIAPGWAALGAVLLLFLGSTWLAREAPAQTEAAIPAHAQSAQPNIVILVMDTVRADHLSLYGYERDTTPNLKALARDSIVYTNAIAPSDMTLASHASLFTGLYPSWHGAHCQPPEASYGRELFKDVPTLAEILAAKGYATLGVSANVYLRAEFGLQRGFDDFVIPRPLPVLPSESYWYLLRTGMRRTMSLVSDTAQFDRLYSRSEDVNSVVFRLASGEDIGRRPFLLFANYMDAHFPYIPPAPFDRRFPGKQRGLMQEDMEQTSTRVVNGAAMPGRELAHRISQYDGGIAYIDARIGQVVDWLKRRGVYDNTLLIVTSDHGEGFGEKHLVLHANSTYQNLLHVPLLIKLPHGAGRGRVDRPVSLVDVAPTVLAALGLAAPKPMQGRNLLVPGADAPRRLFAESFPCPTVHPPECGEGCLQRAVFSWPEKFLTSSSGRNEFYDLSTDPHEDRNLLAADRQAAGQLSAELTAWVNTKPARANEKRKVDADSLNRLKSLGYVQ